MFPLPDEFWQPPKLTMKQKKEYIDLGKRMLQMSTLVWSPSAASHVLATSHLLATGRESDENECYDGHVTWQFLKETQGVSLFRGDSNGSVIPDVRAVGKITATMDEVMDMIICDTTAEYRTMSKKFNDDFLDGQVIHTIIPRTEDHPNRYMGIKWMALKSPKGFKTRDYCFLEYIDVCRNKMGHRAGFRVAQSIDMYDVVPSLEETHDIIRGHMLRDCHIFSASGHRGSLKITHTIKLNPQGKLSNRVTRRMMEKSALNILNVEKYIEAERISQMRFVDVTEFISPKAQADCGICHRNIHLFRPGQNCITCGNLICSSCALVRQLDLPVVGNRKVRICHNCVLISRHCPEERELELLQQEEVKIQEVERPVELQTQVLADQVQCRRFLRMNVNNDL